MYEEFHLSMAEAKAYAERIHLDWPITPNFETLDKIIYLHQCYVPFENLDVVDGRKIPSLDMRDLFHKVVEEKRGGYCFEVNKLCCAFLNTIGFPSYPISCRITWEKKVETPLLHEATITECDGTLYYCDVGYGGPQPGGCLPLIHGNQRTLCGSSYMTEPLDEHWWQINLQKPGRPFASMLQFLTAPIPPASFEPLSYFCATKTDFYFYQNRVVNMRTSDGTLALINMELTERSSKGKSTRVLSSKGELSQILLEKFGLTYTFS